MSECPLSELTGETRAGKVWSPTSFHPLGPFMYSTKEEAKGFLFALGTSNQEFNADRRVGFLFR
jgi:hypothetical protein